MARILTIEDIQLHLANTTVPTIVITAIGTVNSGGWSKPRLSPWVYLAPPEDGIYDFDLEANPPGGITTQVITVIATTLSVPNPPNWLKGIRVHASSNYKVASIEEAKVLPIKASGITIQWDGDLPWPDVLRAAAEGGSVIGNG